MDPVLQAALAAPAPMIVGAVEILLPDYPLRLLDGDGEIAINGHLFVGEDPAFGVLSSISTLTEGDGSEAPEIEIEINPPDASVAATLANSTMQGAIVRVLIDAVDPATGMTTGYPDTMFLGEVDVPELTIGENGQRVLKFTVVSVWERLFDIDEGTRASDGFHQAIWPDELGLQYMTGTDVNLYWGAKRPSGALQSSRASAPSSQAYLNLTGGR